jgi:predicted TIM-barrel enzyme
MLAVADGAIIGTSLKEGGSTWSRVDPERAARMVELFKAQREAAVS